MPPKPRKRLLRPLVMGVAGQAGIVDLRDLRVPLEPGGDLERALVLGRDPQRERLDAALQQEARVRVGAAAQVDQLVPHLLDQGRAADHAAGHQVRVAVQVLGRAVDHEVEAQLQRPQVDRCREGVVDDAGEAVGPREPHDALEIRHLDPRVRHGLDVDRLRLRPQRGVPAVGARRVDEGVREPEILQVVRDEGVRASVEGVLRNEVAAAAERDQQRRGDGGHSARRHQAGLAALEVRHLARDGRVARHVARPDVVDVVVAAQLARQEHARVVDRRGDGRAGPALGLTRVDGACGQRQGLLFCLQGHSSS